MPLTLSKVVKLVPSATETSLLERTFSDSGVVESSLLVYYNGAAINHYPNTTDQSLINEKFYALYRITATALTVFVVGKTGFRSPKYDSSAPLINLTMSTNDSIVVTYQYTR